MQGEWNHVDMKHVQSNTGSVYYRKEERDTYQQQHQQQHQQLQRN